MKENIITIIVLFLVVIVVPALPDLIVEWVMCLPEYIGVPCTVLLCFGILYIIIYVIYLTTNKLI